MKRYAILSLLASVLLLTGAAHAQTLVANPNPINLFAQAGGNPVTANLNFTSSDNVTPLSFSIAAGNPWITLSAAPSGGWKSPATVVVTVNPATLNSGANSGSISVFFNNSTFIVPVNVTVSSISVFPTSINLGSYQAGSTIYPQSQTLTVSGAGGQPAGNFTLSKASADTWYTAAAFGNPLSGIVVSFNSAAASTLTPNTTPLQGTLTITPSGSNPVPVTVPISLTVTASPQVTVSPTSLTFNWQAGGTNNQTTQTLTLSTNSSQPVNFTVTRQNANWLSLPASNPTSVSSSASAQVSVVVDGSNQTNTSGSLILNVSGALFPNGTTQMTIPVALNVSNSPLLYLTSASALTFSYQFGGATLQSSQNVTLASSGAPNVGQQLSYNVSVSANAPFTIAPTGTLTTPTGFSVTANAAGLSPGSYSGTITVTPVASGSGQGPITIPVTLNVTFTPILLVSTTQLVFPWQVGQAAPSSQTVSLSSSTGAPLNYTISPPAVSWLQVTSSTGSTSGTTDQTFFTVTPVIGSVTAQTSPLDATITVTPTDPNTGATLNTVSIDVKLYASATPVLIVSPTGPLQFSTWPNAPAYPLASSCSSGSQLCTINLTSSSSAPADILSVTGVQRTVASQSITGEWVGGTNPAGNTPANFTVNATQLSATAMPAGTYSGTVSITATNSGGTAVADSPFSLPVLFTVNSAKGSVVTPQPDGSMQFTQAQNGNAPASQTVQVNTDGVSLPFTAVVNTGPLNWLSVSKINGPTPGSFNVQANAANLTTGTYHGAIYVSIPNAESSPIRIPVTFTVTGGSIAASQSSLTFTQILGASPATAQTVQITSNPTSVNFTASTSVTTPAGGNWLSAAITAGSGSTPGTVTVSITPGSLAVGQYSGAVTVTSTGVAGSPITIPVTLNVVQATISAPTTPLTFNQLAGGPAPANQTLQVTSTPGPIGFTVSTSTNNGTGWLTATVGSSGTSGTTPANVVVSVNGATLSPGPYSGLVTITSASATGSPITIPIALNVGTAITLTPSQTSLTFSAVVGQTTPSQTVALTSTGSTQFTAAATTTSGGNWLSVSPTSGTATTSATTLTIAAATASLTAGNYSGIVSITSSSSLTPITINVSLTVSAIPTPVIGGVANAASYATGSISPGENITIYGTGIGPAQIVGAQLTSSGKVSTNVGQTQVTFDGIAAPIIYASATQTSVMVPYEIGGRASTSMQITYSGVSSASIPYTVVPAIPGLYTQNLQGTGPGVILNPDGVTVNGPTKPAPAGSEVALYMTGEGATSPASTTGGVAGSTGNGLNTPLLNVTATIAGLPATVVYKGSAPGDVYGIMQLNLIIPSNAPSGAQPIVITVGSTSTQSGVTIQIQ